MILGAFVLLRPESKEEAPQAILSVQDTALTEKDSDGDGLLDWEESLWKLDPNNPDTDGDGISDNQYAQSEASFSASQAGSATVHNIEFTESDSETDKLSKELFAEYITLKQSNAVSPVTMESVVTRLIDKYDTLENIRKYTLADIKLLPNENQELVREFANSVAAVKVKYTNLYTQNQISAADTANPETELVPKLRNASLLYEAMAGELLLIPAPQSLTTIYLELINSYLESAAGLHEFSLLAENPLVSAYGIQKHIIASDEEYLLLQAMAGYFQRNGIIFAANEIGAFWNSPQ